MKRDPAAAFDVWHLAVPVRDLEASLRYYVDGLGFEFGGYWEKNLAFVRPPGKEFNLEFMEMAADAEGAEKRPHHLAFECEDLEKFRAGLIAKKKLGDVPEIKPSHSGMRLIELKDPDGNRVQFYSGSAGFHARIRPTIAERPRR